MDDLKGELEAIRALARSRVKTLNEGEDIYDDAQKIHFLQQYESKLKELDQLIEALAPDTDDPPRERARPASSENKLR